MRHILGERRAGAIVAPLLLDGARDLTGSYSVALFAFATITTASMVLPGLIRPPVSRLASTAPETLPASTGQTTPFASGPDRR